MTEAVSFMAGLVLGASVTFVVMRKRLLVAELRALRCNVITHYPDEAFRMAEGRQ